MTTRQRRLLEWYEQSDEHLLISGPSGIGKTTLINWFDELFGPFAGYRSFKSGDKTFLANRLGGEVVAIGQLGEFGMMPLKEGFDKATKQLEQLKQLPHELIILDEVGHMERQVPEFVEAILELAKHHRLLMVIRQTEHALEGRLNELGSFELYYLTAD